MKERHDRGCTLWEFVCDVLLPPNTIAVIWVGQNNYNINTSWVDWFRGGLDKSPWRKDQIPFLRDEDLIPGKDSSRTKQKPVVEMRALDLSFVLNFSFKIVCVSSLTAQLTGESAPSLSLKAHQSVCWRGGDIVEDFLEAKETNEATRRDERDGTLSTLIALRWSFIVVEERAEGR